MADRTRLDARSTRRVSAPGLAAALMVCLVAPAFFVAEIVWLGVVLAVGGLLVAWSLERVRGVARRGDRPSGGSTSREPALLRDLFLIVLGLVIVRLIPLAAELDNWAMLRFTLALGGAVAVPYLVSRFVYRERAISFPWRARSENTSCSSSDRCRYCGGPQSGAWGGARWGLFHWGWLISVLVLAWLILPWYFISSGVYTNWPVVNTPDLIARLFVGVGAVGIWDELFFICTVFVLLRRHFPAWLANCLQAIVFVSFLWELGYQAWGPVLTIPFALVQGIIFLKTRSLGYVVTVHLLFDAVVFAVLVHAHNPELFNVFITVP